MISDSALIAAIADSEIVIDDGLRSVSEDGVAVETLYRDAYFALVSRLHDAIGQEVTR